MDDDIGYNLDIIFWLNYHRITYGLIPTSFHLRLTSTNLKQLRRRRRSSGLKSIHQQRDRILLGEWKKMAKHFCNIGPSLAEVLFFTFETLNNHNPKNQLIATQHELTALVKRQHRQFMRQRSVHFGQFLLFLWSQSYLPHPNRGSSYGVNQELQDGNNVDERKDDHDEVMEVIKEHLEDILTLLCDIKGFLKSTNVDRLSYFISAGTFQEYQDQEKFDQKTPLSHFFPFWSSSSSRGGSETPSSKKIHVKQVCDYLRERLMLNKAKYPDYRSHFQHVRRPDSRIVREQQNSELVGGENDPLSSSSPVRETIQFCYGYHEETIVLGSEEIIRHRKKISKNQQNEEEQEEQESIREIVRILGCEDSVIYILCPLKYLEIRDCVNCTIISAPVRKIVTFSKCERCTYIGTCRIISVESTNDCKLNICCNLPPFVYKNNSNLVIGPYNTFYHLLEQHLLKSGINPRLNHFQVPYTLPMSVDDIKGVGSINAQNTTTKTSKTNQKISNEGVWKIMDPKEFRQFVIPFYDNEFVQKQNVDEEEEESQESQQQQQNIDSINPCVIPRRFGEAIQKRMMDVANTFSFIYNRTENDEIQRDNVSTFLNEKFKNWLVKTKQIKSVNSLMDYKVDSWSGDSSIGRRDISSGGDIDDTSSFSII